MDTNIQEEWTKETEMNEKNNNKIDLAQDSVVKIFMYYAIPAILGMLAMTSAGIIDGIFVGQVVGAEALAAVNLALPLLNIFYGIGIMVAMGGATLANIKRGESEVGQSNNLFTITLILLGVISIIATLCGVIFSDGMAVMLGAQDETKELVSTYIRIIGIFFIPFLGSFALDMFLKNDGFSIFPIIASIMGALTNIILDFVFIVVLDQGIGGAALATGIGYTVPTIMMLVVVLLKSSWKIVKPHFNLKVIGEMLFNGSSELLSNVSVGISGFIFNLIIMKEIGTMGVAAYSVANYAAWIAMAVYWGIASAIHPGVTYNKGSGNESRVLSFRKVGILFSLVMGVLLAGALVIWGEKIVYLFVGNNPEVTELAVRIIYFYAIAMSITGVNVVASMYYTAINEPILSATIAALRSLVVLVISVMVLPMLIGENGIWASIIVAEVVTLIVSLYCFKKKPW